MDPYLLWYAVASFFLASALIYTKTFLDATYVVRELRRAFPKGGGVPVVSPGGDVVVAEVDEVVKHGKILVKLRHEEGRVGIDIVLIIKHVIRGNTLNIVASILATTASIIALTTAIH